MDQNIHRELAGKIRRGDKQAFKELFEMYAPRIHRFSLTYLKNKEEAEELVQEVFVKIWEERERLDPGKNLRSYIYKISINLIYQHIRKKNIENAYLDYIKNNFRVNENMVWHDIVLRDMLDQLEEILRKLPQQQQKIFHLSKDRGLTNEEIARELNLSKRTVENHLYRAIAFLKKHFRSDAFLAALLLYQWIG